MADRERQDDRAKVEREKAKRRNTEYRSQKPAAGRDNRRGRPACGHRRSERLEREEAEACDAAATSLRGEFAVLNFRESETRLSFVDLSIENRL